MFRFNDVSSLGFVVAYRVAVLVLRADDAQNVLVLRIRRVARLLCPVLGHLKKRAGRIVREESILCGGTDVFDLRFATVLRRHCKEGRIHKADAVVGTVLLLRAEGTRIGEGRLFIGDRRIKSRVVGRIFVRRIDANGRSVIDRRLEAALGLLDREVLYGKVLCFSYFTDRHDSAVLDNVVFLPRLDHFKVNRVKRSQAGNVELCTRRHAAVRDRIDKLRFRSLLIRRLGCCHTDTCKACEHRTNQGDEQELCKFTHDLFSFCEK